MSKLRYKIVVPVVAQTEDFAQLLKQIPDFSKLIIVNNLDHVAVAMIAEYAQTKGAEVINRPENAGCAGSWNIGLRLVEQGELDYVIILSPSCRWNNNVNDFVKAIEEQEAREPQYFYRAVGQHDTDTHAFAVTKKCVDAVGLFDENFHPVYFEDADYFRRQHLLGINHTRIEGIRSSAELGGGVKKDLRVYRQWQLSAERSKRYYRRKWGGDTVRESFTTPFNNPNNPMSYWIPGDEKRVPLPSHKDSVYAGAI